MCVRITYVYVLTQCACYETGENAGGGARPATTSACVAAAATLTPRRVSASAPTASALAALAVPAYGLAVAAVSEHKVKEQSARLTASSGAAGPTLACPPSVPSSSVHTFIVHPSRAGVSSGVRAGLLFTSLFCLYGTLE